jgi:two-component system, sensor histidine kinase
MTRHLLIVINDILDFSKLEAGKLTLETIDFSLPAVIDGVVSLLGATARGKGLELQSSVPSDIPVCVNGDPNRVRQVLLNLAGNAIKFTERGSVRIAASHRELDGEIVEIRIEVTDSGIGIPADVQQNLFSPSTQADNSTSRQYGGTGLGLAISRQLCAMMGGAIGVVSEPGRGATFWFTVQCRRGSVPTISAPPTQPVIESAGRELQILVAEDNPMIRVLIAKLLKKRGYLADMVVNGQEAVAAVTDIFYDLVLMDMDMPVMDGVSATMTIRGPRRTATPGADHRLDRQCPGRPARELPCRRHDRLPVQAVRSRRLLRGDRSLRRVKGRHRCAACGVALKIALALCVSELLCDRIGPLRKSLVVITLGAHQPRQWTAPAAVGLQAGDD